MRPCITPRRAERGSVLLIALMIVLIMAGAGLLVVENATMKIHTLGSFRVSKQGYYLDRKSVV